MVQAYPILIVLVPLLVIVFLQRFYSDKLIDWGYHHFSKIDGERELPNFFDTISIV